MPVPDILVDMDSMVFIQEDGPGTEYAAMACHAIDSTSIGRADAVRVYCKDPAKRGERTIARTVPGRKEDGTLTITAWSQLQSDLLHRIWQRNCVFGAQTHLDVCGLPTDINAFSKMLDYYGVFPGTLDYSNLDNLEGGEGAGLQVSLSCTYADLLEVLQVELLMEAGVGVAATAMTCVAGDVRDMCLDECGVDQRRCDIVMVGSDNAAGAAPVCHYTDDGGLNWGATTVAPTALAIGTCGALITGDRWYLFLDATAGAANAATCLYTDDHGATAWVEVNMGGALNTDYITNAYAHDAGNIYACGALGGPLGTAYHSHDMGVTWTRVLLATPQFTNDIATSDGDTIWVALDSNLLEVSHDGGHSFAAVAGPAAAGTQLTTVRALTPDHVIVGTVRDAALRQLWQTFDGGDNWHVIAFPGSVTAGTEVFGMSIAPTAFRQHLFMVQGLTAQDSDRHCLRSLDGGATWTLITDIVNTGFTDVFACDSNHAWISEYDDNAGSFGRAFRVQPE